MKVREGVMRRRCSMFDVVVVVVVGLAAGAGER